MLDAHTPRRPGPFLCAALLFGAAALLSACGEPPDGPEPDESVGKTVHGLTVEGVAAAGACTTSAVRGLSEEILQVVNCARPGIYAEVPSRPNLSLGSAVFPFLETPARDELVAALDEYPGTTMNVTSMLRSVVAQYLLYYWYLHGMCGISLAASPGSSNHESGLAIDVSNYSTWQTALAAHSFAWYGASDAVHFTYTGSGAVDLRSDNVLAFQRLWNYNNPGDPIAEDGDYGPQTEARLKASPQDGFGAVPPCTQEDAGAQEDASAPVDAGGDDAAPAEDAGGDDAGADDAGADDAAADDGGEPDGGGRHQIGAACGCTAPAASGSLPAALLALMAAVALRRSRRRRPGR